MAEPLPDSEGAQASRTTLSVPAQHGAPSAPATLAENGARPAWSDLDGDLGRRRPASGTNLSGLLHGLRRHWVLGLVSAVIFSGGAATGAWLWFTPAFSAFTILRVAATEPKFLLDTVDSRQQANFEIYKRTQKELMRSRFVLNAALRAPEIERLPAVREQTDAVTWIEKGTYVDFPGEAEIMRITFSDSNAETAAAIANAVTKAYMQEVVDVERRHRMDRLNTLEKVFNDADDKMRTKHAELRRLADSLGTGDGNALSSKQQISLQHFATLRGEHTRLQFELMRAKLSLAALEADRKDPGGPAETEESGGLDEETLNNYVEAAPEIAALMSRLDGMRRSLAYNETVMVNDKHPRLKKQREELAQAEKDFQQKYSKVKVQVRKDLTRKGVRGPASVVDPNATLRNQVTVLTAQEQRLAEDVERLSKEADSIGRSSIEVEMMRAEMRQIERLSSELANEIEALRVELRSPSRVIELQAADVPRTRDTVGRIRTTCIAGLLGFLLPFLTVSLWDSRAQRVNTAFEIADGLGMRIVGALPVLPAHAKSSPRRASRWCRICKACFANRSTHCGRHSFGVSMARRAAWCW